MEVCVQRVPWDLVGFSDFRLIPWVSVGIHVCLCGFRSGSSDLWFSSLAMVAALVHWFFGDLGQRLPHRLLPQALVWQALPGSSDGGARTVAHLWLVLVLVAVVRWSEDLFVIFITFRTFGTAVDDLIDRWSSSQKKKT